ITRFPPSPTGYFHIGSARTALFNFLFAKHNNGKMLFRSEDTDKERSKKEFEEDILKSMDWLHIDYDNRGEVIRQSERTKIYQSYLEKMIAEDKAYLSKEESKKEAGNEVEVIRFKNPNKRISFEDIIRGEISFDTTELGDFVIAKSMTEPLYHLSVVVDDYLMGITHVIRGEDGISNTPRQILIEEAIGAPRPIYGHLPLVLAPDRSKLSKRVHGEFVSLDYYKKRGYLPEAIINFLALLGWNPGGDQEIFGMDEFIEKFDISKVQKSGAIFNIEKLDWFNKEHLKRKSWEEVEKEIIQRLDIDEKIAKKLAPSLFERINKYGDLDILRESGDLDYYTNTPKYEPKDLVWKKSKTTTPDTKKYLEDVADIVEKIEEKDFTEPKIKNCIFPYAEERGRGDVLWATRFALSGKEKSPDPFTLSYILGKEESIRRLRNASKML
ncbi:MAG: glutamate--tRNA ligase family protein, partial [Patescibacteria group bacterium]